MSTFLLEIGTEELPADFARLALPQLEQMLVRDFQEAHLGHGAIHCTSTPRRLAVTVEHLEARTPDRQEERKGPPAGQAFRDGVPTQAAMGFANRCGVAPEARRTCLPEQLDALSGRGLFLIHQCFDDVRWSSRGNRVQVALRRTAA